MQFDFLVIGSGIAGLWYSLKVAATGKVGLITKKHRTESNTNYAQGGIAAVMGTDDTFELHIRDTLTAGAGLCREEVVRSIVSEGPDLVRELITAGVKFSAAAWATRTSEPVVVELSLTSQIGVTVSTPPIALAPVAAESCACFGVSATVAALPWLTVTTIHAFSALRKET